jgi:hypothetical protein
MTLPGKIPASIAFSQTIALLIVANTILCALCCQIK